MDDFELLKKYAEQSSEEAFRTLTARYVNLVYSAARRQVSNTQLAEEITQAVFLILANKAGSIRHDAVLSAWLLQTTRYTAANVLRREIRRERYEREAMFNVHAPSESEAAWEDLAPVLDEAMVCLRAEDRNAVTLRFFEKKSFREVAETLRTTEDNAQKRVSRALAKLRAFFERRGVVISSAVLATALTNNSVQAAPAALATLIAANIANGAAMSSSMAALVQLGTMRPAWPIAKAAAMVGLLLVIALVALPALKSEDKRPLTAETNQTNVPVAATTKPAIRRATAPPVPAESEFRFRVVDAADGKPVRNVTLAVTDTGWHPKRSSDLFRTGGGGWALLPRPTANVAGWNYEIEVSRDGYVPKYVTWGQSRADVFQDFPAEYTAQLDRGTLISATVLNDKDEPISGALVVFSVSGPAPGATDERERVTMMGNYHVEKTDAQGRWRCDHVPAKFGLITWKLSHPDYKGASYECDAPESPQHRGTPIVAKDDLLAGTVVMKMEPGFAVGGTVVDTDGKPLIGVRVTAFTDYGTNGCSVLTDDAGQFRFRNGNGRPIVLLLNKHGYAPANDTVRPEADVDNLRYTLGPGQVLRGKIVNESGEALTNVTLFTSYDREGHQPYEWHAFTDNKGAFSWDSAPKTEFPCVVVAAGYKTETVPLMADGTEHTITLKKAPQSGSKPAEGVRITCIVVSAASHMPVERFKVSVSQIVKDKDGTRTSNMSPVGNGSSGRMTFVGSPYAAALITEVAADGYVPARLTNEITGKKELLLKFELEKGKSIEGVVRLSNGGPVEGAHVFVTTDFGHLRMHQPRRISVVRPEDVYVITDREGRFSLPQRIGAKAVVVAHPLGFAEMAVETVASSRAITLEPWASIKGALQLGGRRMPNETISVNLLSWDASPPPIAMALEAKTSADGTFVLEGVPPGEYSVGYRPAFRNGKLGTVPFSHGVPVTVKAGETAEVTVGGIGRAVIGRVLAPETKDRIDWLEDVHELSLKISTVPQQPKRADFVSDEEFTAASKRYIEEARTFWQSPAGKMARLLGRRYVLIFSKDGTFRADDVPPGDYRLHIAPTKPETRTNFPWRHPDIIGEIDIDLTVPDDGKNTPVDLGALEIKLTSGKRQAEF